MLEKSAVVAVPPQIRNWGHFQHGEDVGLITLQAGHRQIVKAVDKGPQL